MEDCRVCRERKHKVLSASGKSSPGRSASEVLNNAIQSRTATLGGEFHLIR
jgi:hypothetical protein